MSNQAILPTGAQCPCGYELENDAPIGAGCPRCARRLVPAGPLLEPNAAAAEVRRLSGIIEAKEATILELQKKLEQAAASVIVPPPNAAEEGGG